MFAESLRNSINLNDMVIEGKSVLKSEVKNSLNFEDKENCKQLWLGYFKENEV